MSGHCCLGEANISFFNRTCTFDHSKVMAWFTFINILISKSILSSTFAESNVSLCEFRSFCLLFLDINGVGR